MIRSQASSFVLPVETAVLKRQAARSRAGQLGSGCQLNIQGPPLALNEIKIEMPGYLHITFHQVVATTFLNGKHVLKNFLFLAESVQNVWMPLVVNTKVSIEFDCNTRISSFHSDLFCHL